MAFEPDLHYHIHSSDGVFGDTQIKKKAGNIKIKGKGGNEKYKTAFVDFGGNNHGGLRGSGRQQKPNERL